MKKMQGMLIEATLKHRNKKNQKKIEHQGGVGNFQGISYKCNLSL